MGTHSTFSNCDVRMVGRRFEDADEATQVLSTHRDIEIKPVCLEPFQASIYQADFGDNLTMIFAEVSSPVHVTGDRRNGFVHFGSFLHLGSQPTYVHQHHVGLHTLCGFDTSRNTDSVYSANLALAEIQVRQDLLESTLVSMRRDDLDAQFLKQELVHLPTTLSVYRRYMQDLMHLVKQRSPLLDHPDYQTMILGDVLPLLIDAIPKRDSTFWVPTHPRQRAQLVRRATEYIETHIHTPLTLKDLYTTLGVSRRTLFYSFESVFGVTPMEYVKVQRLQGVRRSLKAADPKTASVVAIAHQWGFWHSGRFAQAYKALFHELPSQTLDSYDSTSNSPT